MYVIYIIMDLYTDVPLVVNNNGPIYNSDNTYNNGIIYNHNNEENTISDYFTLIGCFVFTIVVFFIIFIIV